VDASQGVVVPLAVGVDPARVLTAGEVLVELVRLGVDGVDLVADDLGGLGAGEVGVGVRQPGVVLIGHELDGLEDEILDVVLVGG
jgi:hypothetical protein